MLLSRARFSRARPPMRPRLLSSKSRNTCPANFAVNFLQNAELFHLTSFLSHSSALFRTRQNPIPFIIIKFRTLSQKHPGVGTPVPFERGSQHMHAGRTLRPDEACGGTQTTRKEKSTGLKTRHYKSKSRSLASLGMTNLGLGTKIWGSGRGAGETGRPRKAAPTKSRGQL